MDWLADRREFGMDRLADSTESGMDRLTVPTSQLLNRTARFKSISWLRPLQYIKDSIVQLREMLVTSR